MDVISDIVDYYINDIKNGDLSNWAHILEAEGFKPINTFTNKELKALYLCLFDINVKIYNK